MRQRLSPRDTTVVANLGATAADDESLSDGGAAVAICCCDTGMSCRFAICKGEAAARATPARDPTGLEPGSTSSTATDTFCLEVACLPSGRVDLNVSS